jgi:hypothetical protein
MKRPFAHLAYDRNLFFFLNPAFIPRTWSTLSTGYLHNSTLDINKTQAFVSTTTRAVPHWHTFRSPLTRTRGTEEA